LESQDPVASEVLNHGFFCIVIPLSFLHYDAAEVKGFNEFLEGKITEKLM